MGHQRVGDGDEEGGVGVEEGADEVGVRDVKAEGGEAERSNGRGHTLR